MSETRGSYRFQHGSGARQRCRGSLTLWVAATYMWLRRSDLGCLRERTGKEGETRRICYRKIDFVLGCSRREVGKLASEPGKPIKRYASGKFLPTCARRPTRVSSDSCDLSMNRQVSNGCAWGSSLDGLAIWDRYAPSVS